METYYVGAYWGDRRESADECGGRAVDLLNRLAQCDELFARWFKLGWSRKQALQYRVRLDHAAVLKLLLAGRNRRDADRTVIEELGFTVGLWTGGSDDHSASLLLNCGGYAEGPGLANSCVIQLPYKGPVSERVLQAGVLEDILDAVARSWGPDWATVISPQYRELAYESPRSPRLPLVGWLLYLSGRRGPTPDLSPPSRIAPINGLGNLVVVTDERFTVTRPDHLQAAAEVRKRLADAGLLLPTPLAQDDRLPPSPMSDVVPTRGRRQRQPVSVGVRNGPFARRGRS